MDRKRKLTDIAQDLKSSTFDNFDEECYLKELETNKKQTDDEESEEESIASEDEESNYEGSSDEFDLENDSLENSEDETVKSTDNGKHKETEGSIDESSDEAQSDLDNEGEDSDSSNHEETDVNTDEEISDDDFFDVEDEGDEESDFENKQDSDDGSIKESFLSISKNAKNGIKKHTSNKKAVEESSPTQNKDKSNLKTVGKKNKVGKSNSNNLSKSKKESVQVQPHDEYAHDSSDEEDLRTTIGNVPINWYDECDHFGYNTQGEPILKPKEDDAMDRLLRKVYSKAKNRTIKDPQTGQLVELVDEDLSIIQRLSRSMCPDPSYNIHEPFLDLYSHEVMDMPLSGRPEHKRSFLPPKSERQKIRRIASLIKQGIYKHKNWRRKKSKKPSNHKVYDPWKNVENPSKRKRNLIPAPKLPLPGPAKSYNPPPEYLINKKQLTDKNAGTVLSKLQQEEKSIRKIPAYQNFFREFMQRLHDLNFGSRGRMMKVQTTSSFFLPTLPSKHDLRPYPTMMELTFQGHRSIIRTISVHPNGELLASGSDDQTVRIWEVMSRRCIKTFSFDSPISCVSWNPNPKVLLVAVTCGPKIIMLNPESYIVNAETVKKTNYLFKEPVDQGDFNPSKRVTSAVKWRQPIRSEWENGHRLIINMFADVSKIVWHKHGDFFLTIQPTGISRSIVVHQLSKWRSQIPFRSNKGLIQDVQFHPLKPWLFLASQTLIRVYDMQKQKMLKKVKAQTQWISSMSIHPSGEHFLIGTYDKQVSWFEFECTSRPHKLQFHHKAVRAVQFHRKYPLLASCSDDGSIIITHGTAYEGWEKDPLIIPLKRLYGHMKNNDLCALDIKWHPKDPTLFSAGADGTIIWWH